MSGSGASVYPFLITRELEQLGVSIDVVHPSSVVTGSAPFCWNSATRTAGYFRIARISVSLDLREWVIYFARVFRFLFRKTTARRSDSFSTANADAPFGERSDRGKLGSLARKLAVAARDETLVKTIRNHRAPIVVLNTPYDLALLERQCINGKSIFVICHDVLHLRSEIYRGQNWALDFVALSLDEEKTLLGHADVIIAISDEDAQVFKAMLPLKSVITLPPPFRRHRQYKKGRVGGPLNFLFIGGGAQHNLAGVNFLLSTWRLLNSTDSVAQLIIAGGVCEHFDRCDELPLNVTLTGKVEDLETLYSRTDASLCVVTHGSGVKIKTLEALSYGVPIICTPEALRGIAAPEEDFPSIESPDALAALIATLMETRGALEELRNRQSRWAASYLEDKAGVKALCKEIKARTRGPEFKPPGRTSI